MTETTYQLESFHVLSGTWVDASMTRKATSRVDCESMVQEAIERAPRICNRKFRCRQETVKTIVIKYPTINQEGA